MTGFFALNLACILVIASAGASPSAPPQSLHETARVELKIDPAIPVANQHLIQSAFLKIKNLGAGLRPLPAIEITLTDREEFEGGVSSLDTARILVKKSALGLSDSAFEAFVLHEFVHFVIARNFRISGGHSNSPFIFDYYQSAKANPKIESQELAIIHQAHLPFAELLCDAATVIVQRDPRTFVKLFNEMYGLSSSNPEARAILERAAVDQPRALASRDFSVSPRDERWASFAPADLAYNRFNQIRSYLWHRWIKDLPANQAPLFFAKLVLSLEPLHLTGQLDAMLAVQGLSTSNEALIQYLEAKLAE